jgi:hypothetical protein
MIARSPARDNVDGRNHPEPAKTRINGPPRAGPVGSFASFDGPLLRFVIDIAIREADRVPPRHPFDLGLELALMVPIVRIMRGVALASVLPHEGGEITGELSPPPDHRPPLANKKSASVIADTSRRLDLVREATRRLHHGIHDGAQVGIGPPLPAGIGRALPPDPERPGQASRGITGPTGSSPSRAPCPPGRQSASGLSSAAATGPGRRVTGRPAIR